MASALREELSTVEAERDALRCGSTLPAGVAAAHASELEELRARMSAEEARSLRELSEQCGKEQAEAVQALAAAAEAAEASLAIVPLSRNQAVSHLNSTCLRSCTA